MLPYIVLLYKLIILPILPHLLNPILQQYPIHLYIRLQVMPILTDKQPKDDQLIQFNLTIMHILSNPIVDINIFLIKLYIINIAI
jgi:hypothetical protein